MKKCVCLSNVPCAIGHEKLHALRGSQPSFYRGIGAPSAIRADLENPRGGDPRRELQRAQASAIERGFPGADPFHSRSALCAHIRRNFPLYTYPFADLERGENAPREIPRASAEARSRGGVVSGGRAAREVRFCG